MCQLKRCVFMEHVNQVKGKCFPADEYRVLKII